MAQQRTPTRRDACQATLAHRLSALGGAADIVSVLGGFFMVSGGANEDWN